jgi:hypothetical protein
VSEHPRIGAIAERIDGDVLDGIGRLWNRGKGRPDPEEQILLAKEVVVDFEALLPRGAPSPGNIVMHSSGAARIEPHKHGRHRLEQLWAAFQKRHPNFVARFNEIDQLPWIGAEQLIPLKARVWLDLTARKADGETIDARRLHITRALSD